ncbi:MAG: tRNA (uridine(34)/cytosine(34)/5-carboxymethylaminomethyluridine(34)-2'-O)-methyltransferase TrmL [SAR116 cluster bacterium]|nr:tRNA (uridine(34)/cytosine(34)/5-carboxymethylaminomethyluridine(34)-2'-O)-methyltransferase TrmL [SAR116 cluster bacterium]RPH09891.1 MAG: tRNA (cytidine(34)-2'-O)-methyltransferase [Alphaproteobacteria bacterium TMED54]|tara:strand:- start:3193 stop:3672 length:480 start_codon:yes stop_codon:yes gene_type:complete
MFHIILFNPEIPPNTGNIMRLCSNTGSNLHLIKPLGFDLNSKNLKRAALDYSEISNLKVYDSLKDCLSEITFNNIFAITKFGKENLFSLKFDINDAFLFGNETSGLPEEILNSFTTKKKLRIPMTKQNRSINLSNAASIVLYEAWRQNNFKFAETSFSG